jgi:hypothetical protein
VIKAAESRRLIRSGCGLNRQRPDSQRAQQFPTANIIWHCASLEIKSQPEHYVLRPPDVGETQEYNQELPLHERLLVCSFLYSCSRPCRPLRAAPPYTRAHRPMERT